MNTLAFLIIITLISSLQASLYPHVVVIRHEGFPICGGGLLTSKAVLTSSQCCERIKNIKNTKVMAGTSTWNDLEEMVEVRDVLKFDKYEFCHLVLKDEFARQDWIMPLDMETNKSLPDLNSQCYMTGWLPSEELIHINLNMVESKKCMDKSNSSYSDIACAETKVILCFLTARWLLF